MRILVLSQYWAPENGVPQRRWSWLTKILVEAGHEVAVIAPPPHYQRQIRLREWLSKDAIFGCRRAELGNSGEKILRSGFFPAGSTLTRRILNQASVASSMLAMQVTHRKQIQEISPDLIVGTVPALPTSVVTMLVARLHGVPYIVDLRDAWPELLREKDDWNSGTGKRSIREIVLSKGPFQVLTALTEKAMMRALTHANGIITTSKDLATHLGTTLPAKRDGRRRVIRTVRNVFPPKTKYVAADMSRIQRDELHVLYAGTVGRAQRIDNAVRAVNIAQERGYKVRLRIVGDGAAWLAVRDLIQETGADASIEHRYPAERLEEFYDWADTALVHLTSWEPLTRTVPSKTYELMSVGLHISGVVQGEAAALVEKLEAGHVVEPDNPEALANMWISLMEDRSKLHVSARGREWVAKQRDEAVPHIIREIVTSVVSEKN
ncbi:glycosyltransferase family 4 protein [Corynebacterium sp. BF-R-2]|uniref:glycosyltransferase family 4 protein n=1 Tax=Corynebacterium sp. BF-R-2 TaxID=2943494 RepID=UPI00211E6F7A|nr:glycosyltransferase family 4 protein [Corynebacterium sp. BF-R-2]MCQ9677720.1 glycosyltransferase family 4 protein [Corynebacterium sp. BF-R-2]